MLFVSAGQAKNNRARSLARKRMYLFDSSVDKAAATASQAAWMSAINLARSCAYNITGQTLNATRASGSDGSKYYLAQTANLLTGWSAEDSTNVWAIPSAANSQNIWMRRMGSVSLDETTGAFSTSFASAYDTASDRYVQFSDINLFTDSVGLLIPDGKGLSSAARISTSVALTMNRSVEGRLPTGAIYTDQWSYAYHLMQYKKSNGASYIGSISTPSTTANSTLPISGTFNETAVNAFGPGIAIGAEWMRYTRTFNSGGNNSAQSSLGINVGGGFTPAGAPYVTTTLAQETGYSLSWGTIPIWDGVKYVFEVFTIKADATGDIKQNALCVPNALPDLVFNSTPASDLTPLIAL